MGSGLTRVHCNNRVSYLEIYNDCIRDLLSTLPDEEEKKSSGKRKMSPCLTVSEVSM